MCVCMFGAFLRLLNLYARLFVVHDSCILYLRNISFVRTWDLDDNPKDTQTCSAAVI